MDLLSLTPVSIRLRQAAALKRLVEKQRFAVGNARFAHEREWNMGSEAAGFAKQREAMGETVLYAALEGQCVGVLAFSDMVKANAADTVKELRALGVSSLLATGDHEAPARAAAKAVGISNRSCFHAAREQGSAYRAAEASRQAGRNGRRWLE